MPPVMTPPPRPGSGRPSRLVPWALVGGATLLFAAVLYWFNPAEHGFYPFCVLHRTTGLLCPGCGSLRALHSLLHGDVALAFRFNPLLVVCLPLLAALGVRPILRAAGFKLQPIAVRNWWFWAGLVVLFLYFILRNI